MLDSLFAWWLILTCNSVEPKLPPKVIWSMYGNLALDFVIGLVPVLGDLADAAYKCNTKNFILLEKELSRRVEERQAQAGGPAAGTGSTQLYGASDNRYATNAPPPRYTSTKEPRPPKKAYDPHNRRGGAEVDLDAGSAYR